MIYRFYFANIDIWAHLSVDVTESVFSMSCFEEIYKVVNYGWHGRIYNYIIKYWVWVWWVKDSWTKMIFVALEIQEETNQRERMLHVAAYKCWLWNFVVEFVVTGIFICGPEIFREVKNINYMF